VGLLTILLHRLLPFLFEVFLNYLHKYEHIPLVLFKSAFDIVDGLFEAGNCDLLESVDLSDGLLHFAGKTQHGNLQLGEFAKQFDVERVWNWYWMPFLREKFA